MNANLFALLTDGIADPDATAIETAAGARITYADLVARAGRMANALAGLGVRPGDRVAAQVEKSVEAIVLPAGPAHRARNHPMMLEHVHRALDEAIDHRGVEDAGLADLGRQRRDADVDELVHQRAGIPGGVGENLVDRAQHPATSGCDMSAKWKAVPSIPLDTVWKSSATSAFGRSSRLNSSPACRRGASGAFSSPGHTPDGTTPNRLAALARPRWRPSILP